MNRIIVGEVSVRLLELPEEIETARLHVLNADDEITAAKVELEEAKVALTLVGLAGKNAEERAANLAFLTAGHREVLARNERAKAPLVIAVQRLQDELSALRAYARLCGGGE